MQLITKDFKVRRVANGSRFIIRLAGVIPRVLGRNTFDIKDQVPFSELCRCYSGVLVYAFIVQVPAHF